MTVEIQEICRQLKPIIGERANRYWLAYLTEEQDGKRDIETAIRLLAVKHLGLSVDTPQTFLSVPSREIAHGEYPLGTVHYSGKDYYPFGLREEEWIQHIAIFGRSGAGKTNTVFVLLNDLLMKKKPFLIFDWKRNYRDLLQVTNEKILVYTVGRNTSPFLFNPLIPPTGTDPKIWLKKLIEIIAGAYYLGEGVMFLLQEALHAVYQSYGVYEGKPAKYPTFLDVLAWLEENPVKGRKALWMDSTMRGIKSICFGPMGDVVNTTHQPNLAALLNHNVILELDALTNNDKNMIIESMLLWIHHYRLVQPDRECFKHAIFIEEAHHILLKKPGGSGGEAITDTILREIRELGEAIVLVDQHPSLISIPALGNSYTTIAMNLKHKSDVNAIAAAMLMADEENDLFGRLPIGEAVIKLQGRWQQPFQIVIPHQQIPKGVVNDARLNGIMKNRNILECSSLQIHEDLGKSKTINLNQRESLLFRDIHEHPLSGVVERYRRLMLSRRNGDVQKNALIEHGLIEPADIPTRSGRRVLLEITADGWNYLGKTGIKKDIRHNEGIEHRFWKQKIAELFKNEGYIVLIEEPINGFTDIIIEKNGKRLPIEVETGKSDWKKNVEKNLAKGFNAVVMVATNQECFLKIQKQLSSLPIGEKILLKSAQGLVGL
jgi:hypothetical protein